MWRFIQFIYLIYGSCNSVIQCSYLQDYTMRVYYQLDYRLIIQCSVEFDQYPKCQEWYRLEIKLPEMGATIGVCHANNAGSDLVLFLSLVEIFGLLNSNPMGIWREKDPSTPCFSEWGSGGQNVWSSWLCSSLTVWTIPHITSHHLTLTGSFMLQWCWQLYNIHHLCRIARYFIWVAEFHLSSSFPTYISILHRILGSIATRGD